MNELNIRIIEIMVKLERTKSIFAKELGVSLPLIAHITSGRNKPGIEIIQKIILTYDNVNPDWLLNGKGSMFRVIPSKSDHSQIHSILNSIASELNEQKVLNHTIKNYHKILSDEVYHLIEINEMIDKSSNKLECIQPQLENIKSQLESN